jgi:Putative transposase/Transposase zinc-binding domain
MRCSMQNIFAAHFESYARSRTLHPRESRAATCILQCHTPDAGCHLDWCPDGHFAAQTLHACRHRSCPRCADRPRHLWIQAELQRLLPCPHFHTVFTLPHELLALWEFNREAMIALLIDSVRASLLALLGEPRHLGATPGLLMCLHTWGRNLSHHPHVHALVSAGGVRADGQWLATREGFLLPLAPLRKLFAGKLLAAVTELLNQAALRMPSSLPQSHWRRVVSQLYRKHWNVQINPPYANGRSVTLYLARYAKGGPLPQDRELDLRDGQVSFDYTDHRDAQRKRLRLHADEFIARILWHAPPKGVHTVRHAGLYASAARRQHGHALLALSLPPSSQHAAPSTPPISSPAPSCPTCGTPLRRRFFSSRHAADQISYPSVPHPTTFTQRSAHLGPTGRSNGHSTAGRHRRRVNLPSVPAACRMPPN